MILAGLIYGSIVILGVACWHLLRAPQRRAVPPGGEARADRRRARRPRQPVGRQPLRRGGHQRAVHEDRGVRGAVEHVPARRLLALPDRRLLAQDPDPSFSIKIPRLLSCIGDRLVRRQGPRAQPAPAAGAASSTGTDNYMPSVEPMYWSMRVMAYARRADVPGRGGGGLAVPQAAAREGPLVPVDRRRRNRASRSSPPPAAGSSPRWAASRGSCRGCCKTSQANSPNVGSATIAAEPRRLRGCSTSPLGVVDFVLMRRFARLDPPRGARQRRAEPVPGY